MLQKKSADGADFMQGRALLARYSSQHVLLVQHPRRKHTERQRQAQHNGEPGVDDVIVEIRQAIEMTSIYRDDIKGTRELFSSILDNRLNNAMKYLTSITLLMAVGWKSP